MIDISELSKKVLIRLTKMDSEIKMNNSTEQLVFPLKIQADGTKEVIRISEQEMRFLFVEEFKAKYPNLYYSIETPTTGKFKLGKKMTDFSLENEGQSASHDMCVYEKTDSKYKRIMNIEFKHRNSGIENSAKDILKLIREEQKGVFIHLLQNTNSNTLVSVFTKLAQSFQNFSTVWANEYKTIQLVILSLEQKKLIRCELRKSDLLEGKFFVLEQKFGSIDKFNNNQWNLIELDKN